MVSFVPSLWLKRFGILIGIVSALLAPHSAMAGDLETAFDQAFAKKAKPAVVAPALPKAPVTLLPPTPQIPLANRPIPLPPQQPAQSVPVPPRLATPVAPPVQYATPFEAQIAALANPALGRIGVSAMDMTTGRTVAVLGDQPFPLASTIKIAIAATFLEGVDQGRWRLTDQYPLMLPVPSKKFDGPVAPVRAGDLKTAWELIDLSLTRSDNHATDALLAVIGGPQAVDSWLQRAGIIGMRLDRDIATMVRDDGAVNPAVTIDLRDSVTPSAMIRLLTGLYRGQWLRPDSRAVIMGAMERCETGKGRIRALLPESARVAHKTGTLSNTASDVGFIQAPNGRSLAVAIYVTGQGSKAERDYRIATIARALYDGYQGEEMGGALLRSSLRK